MEDAVRDEDNAIARALDAFQALLKSTYTVNPTANRNLIAAARAELAQLRAAPRDQTGMAERQPPAASSPLAVRKSGSVGTTPKGHQRRPASSKDAAVELDA
jgi:nucleoid-associated protein YgaU